MVTKIMFDTKSPMLSRSETSSLIEVIVGPVSRTGASFTAFTVMFTVAGLEGIALRP